MIFTYFGIILFLIWEWVKFIKPKPPSISGRYGDEFEIEQSRHPK